MKLFVLLKGANAGINGLSYKSGEIVASNRDLKAMFPTRFAVAPKGAVCERWDVQVNDVVGLENFAVIGNANGISFRIVDRKGNTVDGCKSFNKADAFAKYFELMKIEPKKEVAPLAPPPEEKAEEKEEEEEEEVPEADEEAEESEESEVPEADEEAEESEESEEAEEEEEEVPVKKAKKKKKKSKK